MKENIKLNYKYIGMLFVILFVVLFYNKNVLADSEFKNTADVKKVNFELTFFSDEKTLGSGHTLKDFTVNEEHGWFEYEQNGTKYVVMSGATEGMLDSIKTNKEKNSKKRYMYFFKYNEIFKFKFEDKTYDNKEYYGIILDSWEDAINVKTSENQILSIYVPKDGDTSKYNELAGKKVFLSDSNGFYSEDVAKQNEEKSFFLDLFTNIFSGLADIINSWINDTIRNVTTSESLPLVASRSQIELFDDLKDDIQVSDYDEVIETKTISTINISDKVDNDKGKKQLAYKKTTKIPIIYGDIYTASINTVNLFDIDFFSKNSNSSKAWNLIRNFVNTCSHICMFITAGLIIVMLILRAILFITTSLTDNPAGSKESKDIINSFIKATFLIAGIYVIMTFSIALYKMIIRVIVDSNSSAFLIRVVVDNVYAFNSNFIGYIKFLSLRLNEWAAFGYSVVYFLYTIINLLWFLFMFLRVIVIGLLVVIAPLTAVMTMKGKAPKEGKHLDNIIHLGNWIKVFLVWLWIPVVEAIIIRIIIHIL